MEANLHQAIKSEFTCYYQLDELPGPWTEEVLRVDLPERARDSARRLRQAVGEANVQALVELLSAMQKDPNHPLVQRIGSSTMMIWSDEPEDWRVFQLLIERIIESLQAGSAPAVKK